MKLNRSAKWVNCDTCGLLQGKLIIA